MVSTFEEQSTGAPEPDPDIQSTHQVDGNDHRHEATQTVNHLLSGERRG